MGAGLSVQRPGRAPVLEAFKMPWPVLKPAVKGN